MRFSLTLRRVRSGVRGGSKGTKIERRSGRAACDRDLTEEVSAVRGFRESVERLSAAAVTPPLNRETNCSPETAPQTRPPKASSCCRGSPSGREAPVRVEHAVRIPALIHFLRFRSEGGMVSGSSEISETC
ncbi:hypothetical protein DNTS_012308 [Danionella cerebrum]|uniref:Uncharacterized protein n=1 Tax=Danionella cerebrum TaxID=2873325 RepID=A0A553REQ6_9TELE|nr:hypothetical protein DNTS_012308 [Danionella translucida]TRZ00675.1 hypothetical protein DNTS_012308 [Danionella translucida]